MGLTIMSTHWLPSFFPWAKMEEHQMSQCPLGYNLTSKELLEERTTSGAPIASRESHTESGRQNTCNMSVNETGNF